MNTLFTGILSTLISFQLLFVSAYLFLQKRGGRMRNGLLGIIFLMFACNIGDFALRVFGVEFSPPELHLIDDSFMFLYGPAIYFYVRSVVYRGFAFRKHDLIHLAAFFPFASFVLYMILSGGGQEGLMDRILAADLPAWIFMAGLGIYAHMMIYLAFSWKTIRAYRSYVENRFSTLDGVHIKWLSFIVRTFVGIVIVAMIHNTIPVFGNPTYHYVSLVLLLVFSFYFIHRVLFKALSDPEIFAGMPSDDPEKYAGSNLRPEDVDRIRTELEAFMREMKPYLNPNLVIKELADALNTSPKALSRVINQSFQQSFFDFVNFHRCLEVRDILKRDPRVTILEAMYQAGFNSKSSFNKEFKKLTGETPSEFKNKIR